MGEFEFVHRCLWHDDWLQCRCHPELLRTFKPLHFAHVEHAFHWWNRVEAADAPYPVGRAFVDQVRSLCNLSGALLWAFLTPMFQGLDLVPLATQLKPKQQLFIIVPTSDTQTALLRHSVELAQATSEAEFQLAMGYVLDLIGASGYGAFMLSSDKSGTNSHYSLTALAAELQEHAAQLPKFATCDPVVQHCRTSGVPIAWDRNTYANARQTALWELAAGFEAGQGVAIAVHLAPSRHFLFGVNWNRKATLTYDQSIAAIAAIQTLAVFAEPAAQRLCNRLLSRSLDLNTNLSPRERECLYWVGRGMTDDIIGRILTISPRTVRKHVEACVLKLQASNRTEAAVTATRLGLTLDAPTQTFHS